ncbi:hypothetical protein GC175_32145 [bacterium]|nr:hypothetical protein [bacterium]
MTPTASSTSTATATVTSQDALERVIEVRRRGLDMAAHYGNSEVVLQHTIRVQRCGQCRALGGRGGLARPRPESIWAGPHCLQRAMRRSEGVGA